MIGRTIVAVDLNVCAKQGKASTSGALPSDIALISLMVMSEYLDIIEPVESGIHDRRYLVNAATVSDRDRSCLNRAS
ncbi:hypothetical protein [Chamaesiphon sp.]|uniref:hypothetical protein n=1 Tax=Chamaesiphon sp. TaxID=2814140 RepID=UPI003594698E